MRYVVGLESGTLLANKEVVERGALLGTTPGDGVLGTQSGIALNKVLRLQLSISLATDSYNLVPAGGRGRTTLIYSYRCTQSGTLNAA